MWKTDKNNMKIKQKFHTGTVSKANRTMVKRCKLATLNTQIHDHLLSCLRSIKSGGVKIVLLWHKI